MTKKEIYKQFEEELKESCQCLTLAEVVARIGKTSARCYFADFLDTLAKNGNITPRQAQNTTAPSWCAYGG